MLILEFIKWKLIDVFREIKRIYKKQPKQLHLYGIRGYFGLMGQGKTIGISKQLLDYRKRYGDNIYIMTNYNFLYQDFEFKSWKQLLETYDKPLVVGWDEVQNEFNSRDFKSFPTELLTLLTQNRKGNGIQILYSAQRWDRVDKIFRELTQFAIDCSTFSERLTTLKYYHWEDYVQLKSTPIVEMKMKIRPSKKNKFIQTDYIRNAYDSYKMLESAKSKEYQDRKTIIDIEAFYK